ncbi:MAG: nucleoside-diphosphate sugar epimerase/dehydratase, partial [Thermoanaerobaculia bacterium]
CERIPIRAQIIPGFYELLDGRVGITRFRELQIEDLLGREPVKLEEDEVQSFIRGKTVMVTGAGGSIGSEMARQVAKYGPQRLLLVERAEFVLFETDRELRAQWPEIEIEPLVADVCDASRMRRIFAASRPQVVFHAAAHKHVTLVELNVAEGIRNNVLGTWALGELAGEFGVEALVLISTDKAVRPTSVMGATKRVAELVVQELDRSHDTRYVSVRFGNVLGSTGSVIPIFRQQIVSGGPVTVTHPEMTRYFMTIAEAAQLVLQAGTMGEGGEIFVLDMGEPVRILDLAKDMITLSGLKPYEDVDIVYSGIRPGEKLFEELQTAGEDMAKTRHPKIYIGKVNAYSSDEIQAAVRRLRELVLSGADEELRSYLDRLLPEAQLAG